MTINKTSYVERITIVFNSDGTIKGSSQEKTSEIFDDTILINTIKEPAEPISANEISSMFSSANLVSQISSLTKSLATITEEKQNLITQLSELNKNNIDSINIISSLQFINRFTKDERFAIYQAASISPQLNDFMYQLSATKNIDLTNEEFLIGVNALVSNGLITQDRANIIVKIG